MAEQSTFQRLPTNVVPEKYFIDYDVVDLMNFRFEGSERIQLRVQEPNTKTITCHAVELYVYDVSLDVPSTDDPSSTKTLACEQIEYLTKDESMRFTFADALPVGATVTLSLKFHGFLNDQLRGFYRSEYKLDNETRALAVTQFEACDARRAFVCWDEPALKATFTLSIVTPVELVALSNMHVVQTLVTPKKNAHVRTLTRTDAITEKRWRFAETPIMSTYLVAMVVGEFDVLSGISSEGVVVNVYTPPGQSARGQFSLDVALQALTFFSQQFGIPYPLKKLDMVAIPDFLGAMENWGLVTYMESFLLVDDEKSSQQVKMVTARVVCHELSHQWFGNLVTMEWWTGLWLNEGFAQYMEYDAVAHIFPDWRVWERFVQEVMLSSALVKDAMTSSHPIEVVVHHPHEADAIFDVISYNKGASVVRMLSEFLGRDVFYKGVSAYLHKFSYQNTVTDDLWDALEAASGVAIKEMARSWTQQMGFPLVTLKENTEKGCSCRFVLEQERFFADRSHAANDHSLWDVPLTMITSDAPDSVQRLGIWSAKATASASTQTPVVADNAINAQLCVPDKPHAWLKLNPNQTSFYLVNYPRAMWLKLQTPVKDLTFTVVDRVSLVSSAFALAGAGVLAVADALDFVGAYMDEPEFLVWKEIATHVAYYSALFCDELFRLEFDAFIRTLFARVLARVTWEPRPDATSNDGQFRKIVLLTLGDAGDHDVIHEAKRRFAAYMGGDTAAVPADLRDVVFQLQAAHGDATHVAQLQRVYETSDFSEEQNSVLAAVGLVPCAATKLQVLEWALAKVRTQDIGVVFGTVASDKIGRELVWDYVQTHWDVLTTKLSPTLVGALVARAITNFHSDARAVEIEAFLAPKDTTSYARRIDGALEAVRLKSQALHRDRDSVAQWLKTRAA